MTKVSKSSVHYRAADSAKHCANCSMFRPSAFGDGTCTLVAGEINATDVCDKWEKK